MVEKFSAADNGSCKQDYKKVYGLYFYHFSGCRMYIFNHLAYCQQIVTIMLAILSFELKIVAFVSVSVT